MNFQLGEKTSYRARYRIGPRQESEHGPSAVNRTWTGCGARAGGPSGPAVPGGFGSPPGGTKTACEELADRGLSRPRKARSRSQKSPRAGRRQAPTTSTGLRCNSGDTRRNGAPRPPSGGQASGQEEPGPGRGASEREEGPSGGKTPRGSGEAWLDEHAKLHPVMPGDNSDSEDGGPARSCPTSVNGS